MRAVTETYLRKRFRSEKPKTFALEKGMILTPSARQYLSELRIELVSDVQSSAPVAVETQTPAEKRSDFVSEDGSTRFEKKPEHMTQLHGRTLVRKDHPRIVLRGRLDSLQSDILMLQARLDGSGVKMKDDLLELLGWVRDLLRCEVLEAELAERAVLGLSATELREHSHNPRKFYHIGHLLPNEKMDLIQLELNRLRSTVREVELAAVSAFSGGEHPAGEQIITALNRMSSGIYVLMLRAAAKIKGYGNERHAG